MTPLLAIARREFAAYFATPLASVFLVAYVALAALFAFQVGGLYERGQADLQPLFQYVPWLTLFLVPAVSMRLWSEERRQGTLELLLTLPCSTRALVLGKFLAAWAFTCVALALTVPIWITIAWLGEPDHGTALAGYVASALLTGMFLALGGFISSLTRNQVNAFVACSAACFLLLLAGYPVVLDFFSAWMPRGAVEAIAGMGALTHYEGIVRGVVDLRDGAYFVSLAVAFLWMTAISVEGRKAP
jgi:ABC-2 type transport system permease protein